ncbi:MAG: NADPH:quinone reductase [Xanthomonadaceae bacterium]|nr:NADPH:quinone reductase [Xanthomonadaceae bacterium]
MRIAYYEQTGAAGEVLKLGSTEKPTPQPHEVVVRVHASAVNPSDVKARAGARGGPLAWPRIIPHSDGAGVIEAVGERVPDSRIGQRVWLWNAQWERANGTAAEYIALPAEQAVPLPSHVDFATGACLGIPASTAWHCVHAAGPVKDRIVLVTGGTGTVGHYAVQMAKLAGAVVIATVGSNEKIERAHEAGADHVFNYTSPTLGDDILRCTSSDGVDHIIDSEFGSNIDEHARIIRPNGVIFAYGSARIKQPVLPFYPLLFKSIGLYLPLIYLLPSSQRQQLITGITRLLEQNALRHAIDTQYPLDEIVRAHEHVESGGKSGAVIVAPDQ